MIFLWAKSHLIIYKSFFGGVGAGLKMKAAVLNALLYITNYHEGHL